MDFARFVCVCDFLDVKLRNFWGLSFFFLDPGDEKKNRSFGIAPEAVIGCKSQAC